MASARTSNSATAVARPLHRGRAVVAGLLAVLLLAGAAYRVRRHLEASRQEEVLRGATSQALQLPRAALKPDQLFRRADRRSTDLFPPDWPGTLADLEAALRRDPLRSEPWLRLAEARLLSGDPAAGRAALERSDALDPWFPGQRLRAVTLWLLLGDEERAFALARAVAALGPAGRRGVLREVVAAGVDPLRVFAELLPKEMPAAEWGELLGELRAPTAEELHALFDLLPKDVYDDAGFRAAALRRASDPFLADVVERLWRADGAALLPQAGGAFLLPVPDLRAAPFSGTLPLGWIAPPRGRGGWSAPGIVSPPEFGALRLAPTRNAGRSGTLRALVLRVPVVAGGKGFRLALRVRVPESDEGKAWLTALLPGGTSVRGPATDLGAGWEGVAVSVPPLSEEGFLEVLLDARLLLADGGVGEPFVFVGGILPDGEVPP